MDVTGANRPPEEIPAQPPPRWRQQKHRGLLWLTFWILFLTTPLAPFALGFLPRIGGLGVLRISPALAICGGLLAGIGAAAFILARLYSNTTTQLVVRAIAFALLIALVYAGVIFAGCMMLLKDI